MNKERMNILREECIQVEIQIKALETYNRSQKNKFLKKVCCNFKLLEEKLTKYRECQYIM